MPDDDPHQDIHEALGILPTEGQLAPSSPLYNEMMGMPRRAAGVASNLLGIDDAGRALRGELTPEEAKSFALTAAVGLLPGARAEKAAGITMNKLFPEATWLGASGALHPQDYVAKLGGVEDFAKNFPSSYNKLKPYLPYLDVSGGAGDLSDAAIEKALAKNPGASIFDVVGTHVEGPSTDWKAVAEYTKANGLGPGDFPSAVPFQVPSHAQPLSFNTPALHGTMDRWGWNGPKDQLALPDEQLGVHFGNPSQGVHFSIPADPKEFMNREVRPGEKTAEPRTYPVVLQAQNPLELPDLGSWDHEKMTDALHKINEGTLDHYVSGKKVMVSPELKGKFPLEELDQLKDIRDVRDYIASKGFDSVKYVNNVEDPGHMSYILFQDSPTQRGYVIGARSPFAKFDPDKLHLPSLAASGAGILAYPLASRNQTPSGGTEE